MPACPTYDEAAAKLDAVLGFVGSGDAIKVGDDTLVGFGLEVLDQRELNGLRDVGNERSRWNTHVEPFFAGRKLTAVQRADVVAWRDAMLRKHAAPGKRHKTKPDRKLARTTIQGALNLVRGVYDVALERGLVKVNPAAGVRLPRSGGRAFDPWTYMLLDEQRALLACAAPDRADLIAFALSTGIREGEQWNLRIADVDLKARRATVRFGSNGKPRKNGRILRVSLLPMAVAAAERQLVRLVELERTIAERARKRGRAPEPFNPGGLLWPNTRGQRRSKGEPSWWAALLERVGIRSEKRHDSRPVRWHDLRHTCASSLVSGWYTEDGWSLERVQKHLGHSSITMTQRYAHLAEEAVARSRSPWRDRAAEILSHLRDLNSRPTVYEGAVNRSGDAPMVAVGGEIVARCLRALGAYADGDPFAGRMAVDALGELAVAAAEQPNESGAGEQSA